MIPKKFRYFLIKIMHKSPNSSQLNRPTGREGDEDKVEEV